MTILKTEFLPESKFIFMLSDLNSHEYYELTIVAAEVSFSVEIITENYQQKDPRFT